jgi:hypothetical protein
MIMRKSQAAILCNLGSFENLLMSSAGEHWIVTLMTVVTSRFSSDCSGWLSGVLDDQDLATINCNSSSSPNSCLVIWDLPECARMRRVSTHPVVISYIWETVLARNVFHSLADVANRDSTIVESVRNKILAIFKFNAGIIYISCAKSKAPHNSNLGSAIFLTGVTRFGSKQFSCSSPCWLTEHKYIPHKLSS